MRPVEWIVEKLARWCRPAYVTVKSGNWSDPSIWQTAQPILSGRLREETLAILRRFVKRGRALIFGRTRYIMHPVEITGHVCCEELILASELRGGMEDSLTVMGIG